jgi:hypothetical protein
MMLRFSSTKKPPTESSRRAKGAGRGLRTADIYAKARPRSAPAKWVTPW